MMILAEIVDVYSMNYDGCAPVSLSPSLRADLRIVERVPDAPHDCLVRDVVLRGWRHGGFRFNNETIQLAHQLNGVRILAEIEQQWRLPARPPLKPGQINDFVQRLDNLRLLQTPRTINLLTGLQERFERLRYRPAAMAGVAYPGQKAELIHVLTWCFGQVEASAIRSNPSRPIRGAVVPHASLKASGTCAAHVYLSLTAASWPDTFVIVGPDHTRLNPNSVRMRPRCLVISQPYATPLGRVPVDRPLFDVFCNEASADLEKGGLSVYREHSLEMQLPFLQFLAARHNRPLQILPLMLAGEATHHEAEGFVSRIVMALQQAVNQTNRKVCVLATTDCTHYGAYYGFMRLKEASEAALQQHDQEILSLLLAGNVKAFVQRAHASTYCGILPVWLLAEFTGVYEAGPLFYDVGKATLAEYPQFVGFASFVLY